jgi:hypothetical protein
MAQKTGEKRPKIPNPQNTPLNLNNAEWISLDEYVKGEAGDNIFYIRVVSNSLSDLGVFHDDLLVVDRERQAKNGNFVIAQCGNSVILYAYKELKGNIYLATVNGEKAVKSEHEPIWADFRKDYIHWAVVTHILRNVVGGEN